MMCAFGVRGYGDEYDEWSANWCESRWIIWRTTSHMSTFYFQFIKEPQASPESEWGQKMNE
jgi:hypothetical protein